MPVFEAISRVTRQDRGRPAIGLRVALGQCSPGEVFCWALMSLDS